MDADFQPKLIYLARRNPALSRDAFVVRWRQHGRLGMSMPRWVNIARYVHCDVSPPHEEERHLLSDHDGIGMIWHRSPPHRAAHIADTRSRQAMEADEAATFERPIVQTCLLAREEVLAAAAPGAPFKLTRFATDCGVASLPYGAVGHVRNYPLPPETGAGWGLPSRIVEEFWFASREAAVEAAGELQPNRDSILLLSNEVVLYP
jgi:hypothetical protein